MAAKQGKKNHNWKDGRASGPSFQLKLGELHEVVKDAAKREGVTMTDYIIAAVVTRLEKDGE